MILREAVLQDYNELLGLRIMLRNEEIGHSPGLYASHGALSVLYLTKNTVEWFMDPAVTVYVVQEEEDGPLIGFTKLERQAVVGSMERKVMRVDGVYVVPRCRKTKALALLYRAVDTVVQDENYDALQGWVAISNEDVWTMWQRRGAKVVGVVMEKSYEQREFVPEAGEEGEREGGADVHPGAGRLSPAAGVPGRP